MNTRLLLAPGDELSEPELRAAALDGHVTALGEAYLVCDVPEDASARAQSLAAVIPSGTAACGPSAAWVHGAGIDPPRQHHAQRITATRGRRASGPRLVFHDIQLQPDEFVRFGDVAVTTPERTLYDLVFHRDHHPWAQDLAREFPGLARTVHASLRVRPRVPGKTTALAALRALIERERNVRYDDVTR